MAEKARQPLPWDMRVLAGKGLVEMPRRSFFQQAAPGAACFLSGFELPQTSALREVREAGCRIERQRSLFPACFSGLQSPDFND